ncbi:unnamed protein product, partial [Schistosoma turkestanicum]
MENKPQFNLPLSLFENKELRSRIRSSMGIGYWNAYTKTEKYLSEKPTNLEIDSAELAKHNKPDDMWVALDHQGKSKIDYCLKSFCLFYLCNIRFLLCAANHFYNV